MLDSVQSVTKLHSLVTEEEKKRNALGSPLVYARRAKVESSLNNGVDGRDSDSHFCACGRMENGVSQTNGQVMFWCEFGSPEMMEELDMTEVKRRVACFRLSDFELGDPEQYECYETGETDSSDSDDSDSSKEESTSSDSSDSSEDRH